MAGTGADADVAELAEGGEGVRPKRLLLGVDRADHLLADVEPARARRRGEGGMGKMSVLAGIGDERHWDDTYVARSVLQ